eukprot:jgi/Psemu1/302550/fgenesh1_kg.73_\
MSMLPGWTTQPTVFVRCGTYGAVRTVCGSQLFVLANSECALCFCNGSLPMMAVTNPIATD